MKKINYFICSLLTLVTLTGVSAANVTVKENKMLGLLDENNDWLDVDTYTTLKDGIIWYDNNEDKKISQSDKICIDTECFYVINNLDGNITMISKNNLNAGRLYTSENEYKDIKSTDEGYLKQTSDYMNFYYDRSEDALAYNYPSLGITFADEAYWETDTFTSGSIYSEKSNLYTYINEYVKEINSYGLNVTGRIMTENDWNLIDFSSIDKYSWLFAGVKNINGVYYFQDFWIDWAYKSEDTSYIRTFMSGSYDFNEPDQFKHIGIRPVIELEESDLYFESVDASTYTDKCTVVTGTGKDIGDEIVCGSEHFYIMSNDGKTIEMMSKYNLYVGANWNKYIFDSTTPLDNDEIISKLNLNGYLYYDMDYLGYKNKGTYGYRKWGNDYKIYTYRNITTDTPGFGYQNKIALGVTGEKGNANYPIYATTILFNDAYYLKEAIKSDSIKKIAEGYANFEFTDNNDITYYLNNYKTNLEKFGVSIDTVDIVTIDEINDLVKNVTGKELPLEKWYYDSLPRYEAGTDSDDNYDITTLGDLKEYLSDEYSWLWNTSYWTKTLSGFYDDNEDITSYSSEGTQVYFVSSSGEICYSSSDCFSSIPRAGIRPVVTMSTDNLVYKVYTKTEGNGNVAYVNENGFVKLTITPENGYIVKSIKVTDAKGNEITVEDLAFAMPESNVTVEVTFEKETIIDKVVDKIEDIVNPDTGTYEDIIFIGIISILAISVLFIIKSKKYNKFILK